MNEIAFSVSRQSIPRQQRFPIVSAPRRFALCCALGSVALLLAVTTRRDADHISTPAPAAVARVLVVPQSSRSAIDPDAAARKAMFRPASATAQVRNRFEPESWGEDRAPVAVISVPTRRAFSSPMWKLLLDGPIRPDIDLTHNQTYYGVVVTLPFGG